MRTLYLLRPHGTAGIDGEQLVVSSGEQELDRMALPLLDQILVMGHLQLTTQLIRACLRRGIPIAYLTSGGQCLGRLQPLEGGYRHRARRQAELPEAQRLAVARTLVASKIANGRVVLQRFTRRGGRPIVEATLRRLGQLQALTAKAPCSNHLRGLEGRRRRSTSAASAACWKAMASGLRYAAGGRRAHRSMPSAASVTACCGMPCCCMWVRPVMRPSYRI